MPYKDGKVMPSKWKVPLFDLSFEQNERDYLHQGLDQILDDAYLTDYRYVVEFEKAFAKFCETDYSIAVPNGTQAIEVALRGVGVKGKKVLLPTNTFIATAVAIKSAGGIPVPVDIREDYLGPCLEQIEQDIDQAAAVVTVHMGGLIDPSIVELKELCQKRGVPLIEDAAHAHGSHFQKQKAGSFGLAGCFSHFMTKVMTTGEGGSITTSDEDFYNRLKSLRKFGSDLENSLIHHLEGVNAKMSEFQALLGLMELQRVERRIYKRRKVAARYQENLKGSVWTAMEGPEGGFCSYYKQIVLPPEGLERETVEKALNKVGVPLTGGVYYHPLHRQPVLKSELPNRDYPVADKFCARHFCPPCFPEVKLEQVDLICEQLLKLAHS
jgi:perosamine synthetase